MDSTNCNLVPAPTEAFPHRLWCPRCKQPWNLTAHPRPPLRRKCEVRHYPPRPKHPRGGPGTEATLLLHSLGISPLGGCDCEGFARKMDAWGVAGCRGEHYQEIVDRFRTYATKYDWATKAKAAMLAVKTGLAWKLNPIDPAPGIVDEAIRRVEANGIHRDEVNSMPEPATSGAPTTSASAGHTN